MEREKIMEKPMLTVTEAANLLGYNRDYFCRLVRVGKVRSIRPTGGRYLIAQEWLVDFMEGGGR